MPGPLAGLRIVEMEGLGPAPFAGMMLADHGAEVIRVEREGGFKLPGDPLARSRRTVIRSISSRPDGIALVRDLARSCDGLIEGYPARRDGAARASGRTCCSPTIRSSSTAG